MRLRVMQACLSLLLLLAAVACKFAAESPFGAPVTQSDVGKSHGELAVSDAAKAAGANQAQADALTKGLEAGLKIFEAFAAKAPAPPPAAPEAPSIPITPSTIEVGLLAGAAYAGKKHLDKTAAAKADETYEQRQTRKRAEMWGAINELKPTNGAKPPA